MKTPIELITEERKRQQEKEGWTLEHDDQHTDQSLAMAAALYASPDERLKIVMNYRYSDGEHIIDPWPWPDLDKREDHDRMKRLQIAGALIVAEMERLQRIRTNTRWIMCGLCDTAYDPADTKEAAIHDHPEPQSGEPRDAWIKSGMKYSEWIESTAEGKEWFNRTTM